jgi:hypothetical protein
MKFKFKLLFYTLAVIVLTKKERNIEELKSIGMSHSLLRDRDAVNITPIISINIFLNVFLNLFLNVLLL